MNKTVTALSIGLLIGSAGTALATSTDSVQAVFAKFNFVINGEAKQLKTDPLVVDGTSYLPVREMSDLLGYQLDYDSDSRTIKLDESKKGADAMTTATDEWVTLQELISDFGFSATTNSESLFLSKNGSTFELKFIRVGDEIIGAETPSGQIGLQIKDSETQLKMFDLRAAGIIDQ